MGLFDSGQVARDAGGTAEAIVDVVSKGDTYDALIIYSCLAGLQVLELWLL